MHSQDQLSCVNPARVERLQFQEEASERVADNPQIPESSHYDPALVQKIAVTQETLLPLFHPTTAQLRLGKLLLRGLRLVQGNGEAPSKEEKHPAVTACNGLQKHSHSQTSAELGQRVRQVRSRRNDQDQEAAVQLSLPAFGARHEQERTGLKQNLACEWA